MPATGDRGASGRGYSLVPGHASTVTEVTPGWRFVSIGFEGEVVNVDGANLWREEWRSLHERICVPHPSYPGERHTMFVYELAKSPSVRFAAGEFSNGVWGFFVPESDG